MTREQAKHWLEIELKTWEDECKSKHPIKEALSVAIKALEQEPVIDDIRSIVAEWKKDTWTDNLSYECMIKIAEIIDKTENEE